MSIFVLRIPAELQPAQAPFRYPAHNADYGIEQEFLDFLQHRPHLLVDDPDAADWHYLPVFWTRWLLAHDYGRRGSGELFDLVHEALIDDRKTFTVCQYDGGPQIDLHSALVLQGSRRVPDGWDGPLLSSPHKLPSWRPRKRYRASFVGRLDTHVLRKDMATRLSGRSDVFIRNGNLGIRRFVRVMLASHSALCPRGYGGSSFRFYEALQLGVTPILIGDIDTRPFQQSIPWQDVSFFCRDSAQAVEIIDSVTDAELATMGRNAHDLWMAEFAEGNWCRHVLSELDSLFHEARSPNAPHQDRKPGTPETRRNTSANAGPTCPTL